ncbi:MAG TPA: hypothetical protein VG965_04105 [Patescibacteria group bacterium]|nr:hypothetical protein [Patescibacteria group bacterium]
MLVKIFTGFIAECALIIIRQVEGLITPSVPNYWSNGKKENIIIIPGFAEGWNFLSVIGNFLNEKGYKIHFPVSLGHGMLPIDKSVELIEEYVESHKLRNVTLISHSKGGIIAKLLLDRTSKVKRVISISVPYKGTIWGYWPTFSLRELSYDSRVLKEVNRKSKNNSKITNVYSKYDLHILPSSHSYLRGAKNIRVDVVGHTRILEDEKTLKLIEENL